MNTQRKSSPRPPRVSLCPVIRSEESLLGVRDLHGARRCDPEALQRVFSDAGLRVAFKLHEGDVVFPGDETHLFEAGKPAEDTKHPSGH